MLPWACIRFIFTPSFAKIIKKTNIFKFIPVFFIQKHYLYIDLLGSFNSLNHKVLTLNFLLTFYTLTKITNL